MAKTGEVAAMNCLGSLDLDTDKAAVGGFEHRVDFDVLLRSVVEELGSCLCPCELSSQFSDDEVLDEWTDQRIGSPQPGLGETAQVRGQTTVDEDDLAQPHPPAGGRRRPTVHPLDQEDFLEQRDVPLARGGRRPSSDAIRSTFTGCAIDPSSSRNSRRSSLRRSISANWTARLCNTIRPWEIHPRPSGLTGPANMLEVIVLHFDGEREMVIHAIAMRAHYRGLFPRPPETRP